MRIVVTRVLPACQKGDLAISQTMLRNLRTKYPTAHISLLCRRPFRDAVHFREADEIHPELFPTEPKERKLKRGWRFFACLLGLPWETHLRRIADHFKQADLVLFAGGGSPGGYGLGNLILNALCPVQLANRLDVPVHFSGIGVEKAERRFEKFIMHRVLKKARFVSVRDTASKDQMARLGLAGNTLQTADWAFLLNGVDENEALSLLAKEGVTTSDAPLIGINMRSVEARDHNRKSLPSAQAYREALCKLFIHLGSEHGARFVVFSMNSPPASDDRLFAQRIVASLPKEIRKLIVIVEGDYAPSQIKSMIALTTAFIGTRLHPTLFALSTGVPTMTLHAGNKVASLMSLFGLNEWHIDLSKAKSNGSDVLAERLMHNRNQIKKQLEQEAPRLRKEARKNLTLIEDLLVNMERR